MGRPEITCTEKGNQAFLLIPYCPQVNTGFTVYKNTVNPVSKYGIYGIYKNQDILFKYLKLILCQFGRPKMLLKKEREVVNLMDRHLDDIEDWVKTASGAVEFYIKGDISEAADIMAKRSA